MRKYLEIFRGRMAALFRSPSFKQLTVYSSSAGFAQVIMMVYALIVARTLGPESFGLFAGNYALAGLTSFFVNWGMDTWMLREGGIQADTRVLSSAVLRTKLIAGIVWLAFLTVLAPLVRPSLFPWLLVLVCATDVLVDSALATLVSGLNIQKRSGQSSRVLLLSRGGRLAGVMLLILLGEKSPLLFAGLRLLSTLIGLGLGVLLFRPVWPKDEKSSPASTLKASVAYGLTELLSLVYAQSDVTLLGFLTDKVKVGEYSPALSLVNALMIIPLSIFYILVPLLSKKYEARSPEFKRAVFQMTGIYGTVGMGSTIVLSLAGKPLITFLLGEKYAMTASLIQILSPILFFKAVSFAGVTYLVSVGLQAKRISAQIVSALANVGLNLIFIPQYGPLGAAWVYVFSEFVLMVGYLTLAMVHYRQVVDKQIPVNPSQ